MKVRLEDICSINMGQSPNSASYNKKGIGMPFFQGNADFGELYPTVRIWAGEPIKVAKQGDILISVRAPIGALNIADVECCIGRGLAALTVDEKLCCKKYLWYGLEYKVEELNSKGTGSTFKAINKKTLSETEVSFPPLDEQRKIASVLDKVSGLISKRRKQLDKLDELVKARFVEMFGEGNWTDEPIGEICRIITGTTPSTADDENWNGKLNWITPAEMSEQGQIIYETQRKITEKAVRSKSLTLMPIGTVILSTRAPIGKVGIAGVEMYCNQGFKNLVCSEKINNRYLAYWLQDNTEYLNSLGRGATFKEVSKAIISEIKIPLPPINLQEEFEKFFNQVDNSKSAIKKSLEKLELLKKALMQGYFGE